MPATGRARAWIEILRLPALLTVPGDVAAGWFLADGGGSASDFATLAGASLCLYSAGMVLNDVADVETDRRERPERPIPSGRVSRRSAAFLAALFLAIGVGLAAMAGTAAHAASAMLVALIVFYNFAAKRIPVIGPLAMGGCRGMNVVLGASVTLGAADPTPLVVAASAEAAYIAALTGVASRETRGSPGTLLRWLPPVALAAGLGLLLWVAWKGEPWVPAFAAFPVALALAASARLRRDVSPREVQRLVGLMLGALVLLQTGFVVVGAPHRPAPAAAVLALWPLMLVARRHFRAS